MEKNIERRIDVNLAIEYAKKIYDSENLEYTIEKRNLTEDVYTTSVYLDKSDGYTTQGNGKGLDIQSVASALFEGLEHYYSDIYDYDKNSVIRTLEQIVSQNENFLIEAPLYEMYEKNPNLRLKCLEFNSLNDKKKIFYPTFLVYPQLCEVEMEYQSYSTNNGISAGIDLTEALIHSICELVERNSLSKAMIGLLSLPAKKMRVVEKNSLPNNLKNLLINMENKYGEIIIYDISFLQEFPTYMVVLKSDNYSLPICGCGTSVISQYAMERAILECLQLIHLYSDYERIQDEKILRFFSLSKEITNMLLLNKSSGKIIKFRESELDFHSLEDILRFMVDRLQKNGYEIYYRILKETENFICVKSIIPGFEKFHLIRQGCLVCANKKLK